MDISESAVYEWEAIDPVTIRLRFATSRLRIQDDKIDDPPRPSRTSALRSIRIHCVSDLRQGFPLRQGYGGRRRWTRRRDFAPRQRGIFLRSPHFQGRQGRGGGCCYTFCDELINKF
jgi:hypothetical protein